MPSIHCAWHPPITFLYAFALVLPLGCGGPGSGTSSDQQANRNNSDDAVTCSDSNLSNDPASAGGGHKVTICHFPPGNPANAHTINVGDPAVPAHLAHGDHLGACGPGEGPCGGQYGGQPDAGDPRDGGQGGDPDAGASCLVQNAACGAGTAPCCSPLTCISNVCAPRLN